MTAHRRTAATAATALLSLLAATGCQSAKPAAQPSSPQISTASASASTPRAAASRDAALAPGDTVDGAALARRMDAATRKAAYVRISTFGDGSPQALSVMDQAVRNSARTDVQMKVGPDTIRLVNGTVYFYDPNPGEWSWVSVPSTSRHAAGKLIAASVQKGLQQSTQSQAELFGKGQTTYVGSEFVGGERAARYRTAVPASVMIDAMMRSATGALPADQQATINRARSASRGMTITYDVWIDAQDRPLKSDIDMAGLNALLNPGQPGAPEKTHLTYTRWGVPVQIAQPAAADTVTIDDALGDTGTS